MHKTFFRTRVHIALLAAYIIYGLNFPIAKSLIPGIIKPLPLVALRSIVTALLFWITALILPKEKVQLKDIIYLAGCSLLGIVLNQIFFMEGLNLTTPVNSSLIIAMNPVAVFVFAALILKEKITLIRGAGLAVGLSGVVILILKEGTPDLGRSTFAGNMLTLLSTTSWALFTVVMKRMLDKYSTVTVMKWVFFFGMLVNLPLGLGEMNGTDWNSITFKGWAALGFVVIFATFIGYMLLTFGLRRLSPTVVSSYTYTQPFIAAIVATLIGQDSIGFLDLITAALIFAGVFLISRQQPLN